jgi:nucleoside-diphosphate kinase
MEQTLVLLKPDAVMRSLTGEITTRLEKKGLQLVGMKMIQLNDSLLQEHYSHIADKPFFPGISEFMQSTPVIAQCWQGKSAISVVRNMCGITNSREANPGTIRGDYSLSMQCNLIHASEDATAAEQEIPRFFQSNEIHSYQQGNFDHRYSGDEQ